MPNIQRVIQNMNQIKKYKILITQKITEILFKKTNLRIEFNHAANY